MNSGRIDYSPDYKSEKAKSLDDLIKLQLAEVRKNNKLTDEYNSLKDAVVKAAKAEYEVERTADRGANTITRTDALIKLQPLMQKRREAVAALLEFESLQDQKD